jgi:Holliday junction resolvase RusA-like endonuclease
MKITYRGRPDLDNAAGFIMDALEGIAYDDDRQILILSVRKKPKGDKGILISIRLLADSVR